MWFNNALIYNFKGAEDYSLADALVSQRLKPCPPHARFIYGWVSPMNNPTKDDLVYEVAGAALISLGKEERILPIGVIKQQIKKREHELEQHRGYALSKAEKAQLAQDLEFDLLPKSFCMQKQLYAIWDFVKNRLIINTASSTQASQLIHILRKSIPRLQIEPCAIPTNLAMRFAEWMHNPAALPAAFQWAADCLLVALNDEKKRVTCKGYELPAEEIVSLLMQGLAAAEISLVWNDRLQFTLTQDLVLKRIKCLDYLIDELHEISKVDEQAAQQDAALALLSGELRALIDELLASLAPIKTVDAAHHEIA